MQAVAMNEVNAATYAHVRDKEFVEVKDTGCVIVPEKFLDKYCDFELEQEAARRLANPSGITYTLEEIMTESGFTEKDLEGWEDIEIE